MTFLTLTSTLLFFQWLHAEPIGINSSPHTYREISCDISEAFVNNRPVKKTPLRISFQNIGFRKAYVTEFHSDEEYTYPVSFPSHYIREDTPQRFYFLFRRYYNLPRHARRETRLNIFIGILAAVAIPNFVGFQKSARSSEAKANLGALYTAEKAYFYEASYYCPSMTVIGFAEPDGKRHYAVGFKNAGNQAHVTGRPAECKPAPAISGHPSNVTGGTPIVQGGLAATCKTANSTFIACATGEIATTNSNWKINDVKALSKQ